MKIRSDYLESLQLQAQTPKSASTGEGFESLFAQEIGRSGQLTETSPLLPPGAGAVIDPMLLTATDAAAAPKNADNSPEETLMQTLTGQAFGLLDSWDAYAKTLGTGASSRDAWTMLSSMDSGVKSLRGNLETLGQPGSGLEAVVNELEVLTATEKFKFNRGDYI